MAIKYGTTLKDGIGYVTVNKGNTGEILPAEHHVIMVQYCTESCCLPANRDCTFAGKSRYREVTIMSQRENITCETEIVVDVAHEAVYAFSIAGLW